MPSSDLILNVKQIAGYADGGYALSTDEILLQRGGLGGPYVSLNPGEFVGTALLTSLTPLQVGIGAPSGADGAQAFLFSISSPLNGAWMWNAYVGAGSAGARYINSQPAAILQVDAVLGWTFNWAAGGSAGAVIGNFSAPFVISPIGYVSGCNQVLLERDPLLPMEAATANYVQSRIVGVSDTMMSLYNCATVWSVNGRTGQVIIGLNDVLGAGGAPIDSPHFTGVPTAPYPAGNDYSAQIPTTQWVWDAINSGLNANSVLSFNGRTGNIVLTTADVTGVGGATTSQLSLYAALSSPAFSGVPTAPTAAPGSSSGQLATTAFVMAAVSGSVAGVSSFNTRTGAVVLSGADISAAGGALLAGPIFTGVPQAPTAAPGTSSNQLATTAFVAAAGGVSSFNTRVGAVSLTLADITGAGGAPLASPSFSGVPIAPTAAVATSTTQIATTAFVMTSTVTTFNGRLGAVSLIANDVSAAGGALLAGPAFSGVPTAPTAVVGTNTTQLATTAYVLAAIAASTAGVSTFNGRAGAVTLTSGDITGAGGALLASPTFTGTPAAPTPASTDNSTTIATTAFVKAYLPLAGGTLTGTLNGVAGSFTGAVAAAGLTSTSGAVVSRASGAGNATFSLQNNAGTQEGFVFWNASTNQVGIQTVIGSNGSAYLDSTGNFNATGSIAAGTGYINRAGTAGAATGQLFNFNWTGSVLQAWVGTTNIGNVTVSSDYRIKRDVHPLASMWRRVMALRPISYSLRDSDLDHGDDVERWGFVAHELQETLTTDAATGSKDAKDLIQSPNPWTVIAALTKALQEAMTRIETLEARPA